MQPFETYRGLTEHPLLALPQPVGESLFWLVLVSVAGLFAWALATVRANRGEFLLILTASLAASGMEGWAEFMSMNYHPEIGGHIAYRAWSMPVPIHIVLSYALYFGGPGWYLVRMIRAGRDAGWWWRFFALNCVGVALADFGAVNLGAWIYYGPQPFVLFNVPLWVMFCNATAIFAFGVTVDACLRWLPGPWRLGMLAIAPAGLAMGWAAICLPVANGLHAGASPWVAALFGTWTILNCLLVTFFAIRYFTWAGPGTAKRL